MKFRYTLGTGTRILTPTYILFRPFLHYKRCLKDKFQEEIMFSYERMKNTKRFFNLFERGVTHRMSKTGLSSLFLQL